MSRLGRAIIQSGVDPDEGIVMYRNLLRARDGLNLESLLHVLYLVTPLEHQLYPRFDLMLRQYSKSKNSGISAARIYAAVVDSVGIDTDVLHRWEVKPPSKLELEMCSSTIRLYEINHRTSNSTLTKQPKVRSTLSPDSWRVLCNSRQLWAASALQMVLDEAAPIDQIAKTYGVQAADIENLVHRTRVMASKVCRFCENIGWSTLGKLITDFKLVLDDFCSGHAANADLAPLLSVVRMPVKLARLLVEKCEICTPTEFILVAPEVVAQHLHKLHGFELKVRSRF